MGKSRGELLTVKSRLFTLGGRRILVSKLNVLDDDHLGMEILMSLAEARSQRAGVYFIRPRRGPGEALLALESRDVPVLEPGGTRGMWLDGLWRLSELTDAVTSYPSNLGRSVREELCWELKSYTFDDDVNREVRSSLRDLRKWMQERNERLDRRTDGRRQRCRRRLLREHLNVLMGEKAATEASRQLQTLGIEPGAPLVTVHVWEAGFKRGWELNERKLNARDDSARSARIEAYFDAFDYLVDLGYTVVRIGHPTMTPVRRRGVIDLANAPGGSSLLEIHCLLASRFLIASEAGPLGVSYLTNTPSLTVNATDPISSYPIRPDGMYILKGVVDRDTDQPLGLLEMLNDEYLANLRNTTRYQYIDNSSHEILAAVIEMVRGLRDGWTESAPQREFRRAATQAAEAVRSYLTHFRTWGSDEGFLGDGRIGHAFAAGHL
jgi:putative glycosyltransferase (TIGR04372 family)